MEINNVHKFLKVYKNKSFDEVPLTEGDVIVGTIVSYADFIKCKKTKKYDLENNTIKFEEFNIGKYMDILCNNYVDGLELKKFLVALMNSKRYRLTKIGYFESIYSDDNATQFFAYTAITKNYTCVFFRGTDNSLIGWKEDLDLSFKDKIPSQKLAKQYLYRIAEITNKPIIVAGHSKGGNLAFYSYLSASKKVKDKIFRVYNFDGPGLTNQKLYASYDDHKLIKMVPTHSIIGMLLETQDNYQIVKSIKSNIRAHDLFTWVFNKESRYKSIQKKPPLSRYSVALKISINERIKKYPKKDYKDMAEFIYNIAIANKQKTTLNLKLDIIKKRKVYLTKISNYSKNKKDQLKLMSREFVKLYFAALFGRLDVDKGE